MANNYDNLNAKQLEAIRFRGGRATVLAAPGCGKTHILSLRILMAHQIYGIPYSDMLCITFTNRASREMKDRIRKNVGPEALSELFVGNMHRFCIKFIYDNELVPIDTCLIDDLDQEEILQEIVDDNPPKSNLLTRITANLTKSICDRSSSSFMWKNRFPQGLDFYKRPTYYDFPVQAYAETYTKYKEENKLIDFDDVLLLTYKALMEPDYRRYKHSSYPWIQVDEVQDMNPLQLAICDKLLADDYDSIMYLGDEQQSIYSFLGTSADVLEDLKRKSGENVFSLPLNYRSPKYLLDLLNDYATDVLKFDGKSLPAANDNSRAAGDGLVMVKCTDNWEKKDATQTDVIPMLVKKIRGDAAKRGDGKEESICILVRTNKDAEEISTELNKQGLRHMKITKNDIFKGVDFKTLHSHFCVVSNDTRLKDWVQILYKFKIHISKGFATRFIKEMREIALTPLDLLEHNESSYCLEFSKSFKDKEIVVYDTETTGLDIFEDDIIQIAAFKIRGGVKVPGSELDIIIETDKELPPTLAGGIANPMLEEYRRRKNGASLKAHEHFLKPQEAFSLFLNYLGDDELLGHNSDYDIHILENNISRRTSGLSFTPPACWDTLKLSRLLDPDLRKRSLENLLEVYGLEGANTHNAFDDIHATHSLAAHYYEKLQPLLRKQEVFLSDWTVKSVQKKLIQKYLPLYGHTAEKLYSHDTGRTFLEEFKYVYGEMVAGKYIKEIPMFNYMCDLFDKVVMDYDKDRHFHQQLTNHLYELRTFNENDLFQNGIITENVHLMTIHKAKGLEFDNVILTNVSDGVFPPHWSKDNEEDARVLYVGLSRAKKNIYITYVSKVSPFIKDHPRVCGHFYDMPERQRDTLLRMSKSIQ